MKERIELMKCYDPGTYSHYLGDYDQNREERFNGSNITSDISWLKDTEYQRLELEKNRTKTNETLRDLLRLEDEKVVKSHNEALKTNKLSYDEQLERVKMIKSVQEKLNDLNRRVTAKHANEENIKEQIRLKNQGLIDKLEYGKQLYELRDQYRIITENEKATAKQKKMLGEIDLKIAKLNDAYAEKEAKLKFREIAIDQRKNEVLNNLYTTTFDDIKNYNDVSTKVIEEAFDRYKKTSCEYELANAQKKLKLTSLNMPTTSSSNQENESDSGGGGDDNIEKDLSSIEMSNQLKDISIITNAKVNKSYEKVTRRESENHSNFYKQLTKLAEQLRLSKEENSRFRQNKKLEDHDRKIKLNAELVKTKALEEANDRIMKERETTSKLISNLHDKEKRLLKLQLKYLQQGMSESLKSMLDKEYNTDLDKLIKRTDKINDAKDRMELASLKCDHLEKLKEFNVNTIPPKQGMLFKHDLNNLAMNRQLLMDDKRNVREHQKNYDRLLSDQTKQSERHLNQALRDLSKISKEEDEEIKKLKNRTKDNLKEINNFKKKSEYVLKDVESLEDLINKNYDEDEENALDHTSFLSEDLMSKLADKLTSATDLITELPDLYKEYTASIKASGIDLTSPNPYEKLEKRVAPLIEASEAKYTKIVTDMYESVQKIYDSMNTRISKLYKTIEGRFGAEDQDEDVREAEGGIEVDDDDDDDDGGSSSSSSGGGSCRLKINHNLADRNIQEERVSKILLQTREFCNMISSQFAHVNRWTERLVLQLQSLENKFNISEAKNNTTTKTMKMQHALIDTKHKEIAKAIEHFHDFFKSNMQHLIKLTEKSIRENRKKNDQLKKGLKKISQKDQELTEIRDYVQEYGEFTINQESTLKQLVKRREDEIGAAKRSYETAFADEEAYRKMQLNESKNDCSIAEKSLNTTGIFTLNKAKNLPRI